MPAIRSDSLARSSPAPRIVVVPRGLGRGQAQDRDLVDRLGHLGRGDVDRPELRSSGRCRSASGSPASRSRSRPARPATGRSSMRRPSARSRSMIARRVGLTPTPARASSASGWIAPATSQKRGGRRIRGHGLADRPHCRPPSTLTATPPPASSVPAHAHAPRPEHPLGVIAGGDRLAHRRHAVRPQPGQQDGRLHLGAGHGRPMVDGLERGVADHGHRQEGVASARMDLGAHRAQRLDDTSEGSAAQRIVAVEDVVAGQAGQDPGDQPSRRPGVAAVEDSVRFVEAVDPRRDDPVVDPPAVRRPRSTVPRGVSIRPAVVRTSAPSPAPWIADVPAARAARSRARWLIDLSPGSPGWPRRRAAGRTPATSGSAPPARFGRASIVNACPSRRP